MAENGNGVAVTQQQTQQGNAGAAQAQHAGQETGHCTGDCRKCMPMQRAYCSAQIAYNSMRMLEGMMREVVSMRENLIVLDSKVKNLGEKVEAITNAEGMLIEPVGEVKEVVTGMLFDESDA